MSSARVLSVNLSPGHTMSKPAVSQIKLLKGLGVEGDAHMGKYVKHRSRVRKNPKSPNLRQVHLIHSELMKELKLKGFEVKPGQMGENITTADIDLLELSRGTVLKIGETQIEITGLRNPCSQLDGIQKGLMKAVLDKGSNGDLIRKAGIMGIVLQGGTISENDSIEIISPKGPHIPLEAV